MARSKLVTGLPLNGRRYHGVSSRLPGSVYKTIDDPITNDVIKDNLTVERGYERDWDPDAAAGYLWNNDLNEWVTYEDPASAYVKANYVEANNLAGNKTPISLVSS